MVNPRTNRPAFAAAHIVIFGSHISGGPPAPPPSEAVALVTLLHFVIIDDDDDHYTKATTQQTFCFPSYIYIFFFLMVCLFGRPKCHHVPWWRSANAGIGCKCRWLANRMGRFAGNNREPVRFGHSAEYKVCFLPRGSNSYAVMWNCRDQALQQETCSSTNPRICVIRASYENLT